MAFPASPPVTKREGGARNRGASTTSRSTLVIRPAPKPLDGGQAKGAALKNDERERLDRWS